MTNRHNYFSRIAQIKRRAKRRREGVRRIDYLAVSSEAAAVIDAKRAELKALGMCSSYSDALNAIVVEWGFRSQWATRGWGRGENLSNSIAAKRARAFF